MSVGARSPRPFLFTSNLGRQDVAPTLLEALMQNKKRILLISSLFMNVIKSLWRNQNNGKYAKWISLAAFIPVLGLFFVSFLPNVAQLTLSTGVFLVIVVLLNGSIEELYWRGLYLFEYPNDSRIGFLFSWLLFGAWHISLWFANGVIYKDGFLALVGGGGGIGNLFAFTALFVDNGF